MFTDTEKRILKLAFKGKETRSKAFYSIADELDVPFLNETLSHANKIKNYIDLENVRHKVMLDIFQRKYYLDNFEDKTILAFLIKNLHEVEKLSKRYEKVHWSSYREEVLVYDNKTISRFDKVYSRSFVKYLVEDFLYLDGFEESREIYKSMGIPFIGGGSVADYIESGIFVLKPHIISLYKKLENLKNKS